MDIVWASHEVHLNAWVAGDADWGAAIILAAFPFAAGWPYVLEIQAGHSGYTVNVNGAEQTFFDYQYDPATVDAVRASGAHRCRVQYYGEYGDDTADTALLGMLGAHELFIYRPIIGSPVGFRGVST